MKRIVPIPFLLLLSLVAAFCTPDGDNGRPAEISGFVPVYGDTTGLKTISAAAPRPTVNAGKIYTVGNILLQVEQDSGFHIINYADPKDPRKIGFIRSYLCKELAMKNGLVYTNNLSDLVVININDLENVREVSRIAGVFPDLVVQFPRKTDPNSTIYFECPDPSKGFVVAWKEQIIKNPKCRR